MIQMIALTLFLIDAFSLRDANLAAVRFCYVLAPAASVVHGNFRHQTHLAWTTALWTFHCYSTEFLQKLKIIHVWESAYSFHSSHTKHFINKTKKHQRN